MTVRVLVIDDDPASRRTTRAQLAPEGYEVLLADGGRAALDMLATAPVDVVICDLMMPEVDGTTVCRAFKAHAEWRFVPIVLATAIDEQDALVRALEAGADTFVTKPVS